MAGLDKEIQNYSEKRLFGTKPLTEPMLTWHTSDHEMALGEIPLTNSPDQNMRVCRWNIFKSYHCNTATIHVKIWTCVYIFLTYIISFKTKLL